MGNESSNSIQQSQHTVNSKFPLTKTLEKAVSRKICQKDLAKPDKANENDLYTCPECQSKRENNIKPSNDLALSKENKCDEERNIKKPFQNINDDMCSG